MNNLDRFEEIAARHFTARFRCNWNPTTHDYLGTYLELLSSRPVRKILEIGLGPAGLFHPQQRAGCGVRMWSELFPEADVFGLDNNPATLVTEGKIRSLLCDQSDAEQLAAVAEFVGGEIDLVVDDASHRPTDQALTVAVFAPLLSKTGVYVIEDILPRAYYGVWAPELIRHPHRVIELHPEVMIDDRLLVIEARDLVNPVA